MNLTGLSRNQIREALRQGEEQDQRRQRTGTDARIDTPQLRQTELKITHQEFAQPTRTQEAQRDASPAATMPTEEFIAIKDGVAYYYEIAAVQGEEV